jgi:hypothetical protein
MRPRARSIATTIAGDTRGSSSEHFLHKVPSSFAEHIVPGTPAASDTLMPNKEPSPADEGEGSYHFRLPRVIGSTMATRR